MAEFGSFRPTNSYSSFKVQLKCHCLTPPLESILIPATELVHNSGPALTTTFHICLPPRLVTISALSPSSSSQHAVVATIKARVNLLLCSFTLSNTRMRKTLIQELSHFIAEQTEASR